MEVLNKTFNGSLSFCKCCDTYNLQFNNLYLRLTGPGFRYFCKYLDGIDPEQQERVNRHIDSSRKIYITLQGESIYFCLTPMELEELKELVRFKRNKNKVNPAVCQNYPLN